MRFRGLVLSTSMVVLVAACGPTGTGDWGTQPEPTPTVVKAPPVLDPGTVTTPTGQPEVEPGALPTISCKIPDLNVSLPKLLEPGANVPARGNVENGRFCIGARAFDGTGKTFCDLVSALEARHRAAANCYKQALQQLEVLGADLFDGSREKWAATKRNVLPAAWHLTPTEATRDVGHLSAWMAVLMRGGVEPTVDAEPFCFLKPEHLPVREARDNTLTFLGFLWNVRKLQTETLLGTLRRGVNVVVAPERPPLQLTVRLVEAPQVEPQQGGCAFAIR